jgi:hypothetical protein
MEPAADNQRLASPHALGNPSIAKAPAASVDRVKSEAGSESTKSYFGAERQRIGTRAQVRRRRRATNGYGPRRAATSKGRAT